MNSTAAASTPVVLQQPKVFSLQQLACLYVIGNLQEFEPQKLAENLSIELRFLLMTNIPVSDILKLEHTEITEGVDMHACHTKRKQCHLQIQNFKNPEPIQKK